MSDVPVQKGEPLDLRAVLDALPRAIIVTDPDARVLLWNQQAEKLYGWAADEVLGKAVTDVVVPASEQDGAAEVLTGVNAGGSWQGDFTALRRDGTTVRIWVRNQPVIDAEGAVVAIVGASEDVSDLRRIEQQNADLAEHLLLAAQEERVHRERLEVLSLVNDALAAAGTREEVMANVVHAAVPAWADWCSLHVLGDGPVPDVEIAHAADPAKAAYADALRELNPYDPDAARGIPKVIRTGEPDFFPVIDEAALDEIEAPEDFRQVVATLGLRSGIQVPLVKRGRIIGALQVVMTESRRLYTDEDFKLAEAIGARVASTLENRRLAHEQREIASALQASLLPSELPTIPGIDMAVRYWANGDAVEVGGDFYDAFPVTDGTWALVIGDVCGTGPKAAAITGLARHTIAASAWHGADHSAVLKSLNTTLRQRKTEGFCTALYATIEIGPEGPRLEFASAGHPLPVLVTGAGEVRTIGTPGRLAGLFDTIDVTVTSLAINSGDCLVFYTDGATDVPPPHGLTRDQFEELVQAAAVRPSDPELIADRLEKSLSSILPIADRRDDIAILVACVR